MPIKVLAFDGDDTRDRAMCVHVFADGAGSVKPNGTITHNRTGRVFRWEWCEVCAATHTPSSDQRAEYGFRKALVRIMDGPPAATG